MIFITVPEEIITYIISLLSKINKQMLYRTHRFFHKFIKPNPKHVTIKKVLKENNHFLLYHINDISRVNKCKYLPWVFENNNADFIFTYISMFNISYQDICLQCIPILKFCDVDIVLKLFEDTESIKSNNFDNIIFINIISSNRLDVIKKYNLVKTICEMNFSRYLVNNYSTNIRYNCNFDVLKYFHKYGLKFFEKDIDKAIESGDLNYIEWIYSKIGDGNFDMKGKKYEAENNDVASWLIKKGCRVSNLYELAIQTDSIKLYPKTLLNKSDITPSLIVYNASKGIFNNDVLTKNKIFRAQIFEIVYYAIKYSYFDIFNITKFKNYSNRVDELIVVSEILNIKEAYNLYYCPKNLEINVIRRLISGGEKETILLNVIKSMCKYDFKFILMFHKMGRRDLFYDFLVHIYDVDRLSDNYLYKTDDIKLFDYYFSIIRVDYRELFKYRSDALLLDFLKNLGANSNSITINNLMLMYRDKKFFIESGVKKIFTKDSLYCAFFNSESTAEWLLKQKEHKISFKMITYCPSSIEISNTNKFLRIMEAFHAWVIKKHKEAINYILLDFIKKDYPLLFDRVKNANNVQITNDIIITMINYRAWKLIDKLDLHGDLVIPFCKFSKADMNVIKDTNIIDSIIRGECKCCYDKLFYFAGPKGSTEKAVKSKLELFLKIYRSRTNSNCALSKKSCI